jgi:hypothetical protein
MKFLASVVCLLAVVALARAEDKADPTGTWKYTVDVMGESREVTIKLKRDGDKLTGTVEVAGIEGMIEDGKYKDGEVSFKTTLDAGGMMIHLKYKGTIKGDTFKGKRELEAGGEKNTKDIEAKRSKD